MAVLSKEELMERLRSRFGDDSSDETLTVLEDVTDTIDDYARRADDSQWQRRYDELDRTWREKYRDRFYKTEEVTERREDRDDSDERRKETEITYEDLFEERR